MTSEFNPGSFLQDEMIPDKISKGAGCAEALPEFSGRWSYGHATSFSRCSPAYDRADHSGSLNSTY